MKSSRLAALLPAALAAAAPAFAQPASGESLRGLREFRLVITVDEDATACGVSRERIEASVRPAIASSALALDDGVPTRIGARASTMRVAEHVCAYEFALEVIARVRIEATGATTSAPVWVRKAITCGPTSGAARLIDHVFERATRELLADWAKVNP